jgi:opacity protein-like surface antigen
MLRSFTAVVVAVAAAAGIAAAGAAAQQITHGTADFQETLHAPAGTVCDFKYRQSFRFVDHFTVYGDPDNPTRAIDHITLYVTHTNVNTGYFLTEVDRYNETYNAGERTVKDVGVFWHLRTPAGNPVVVHAGQTVFDLVSGHLVKFTPNSGSDFAAVVCPLLGGSPAR